MATDCGYDFKKTGWQVFSDRNTFQILCANAPIDFRDDFFGADVVIPASGSVESGCKWSKKIVGAAPPTVEKVADEVNGVIACALTADNEKQDAAFHMNDELQFSLAQGVVFEAWVKLSVLPTGAASVASWGLWGAWADGGSAYRVGFTAESGSGLITCECDDNATDTNASSGVTVTASDWHLYQIFCTDQTNIKFFIDGMRVAGSTTFNNAASAANLKCQPHFGMYKATGTTVGTMQIDSVRILQNRS